MGAVNRGTIKSNLALPTEGDHQNNSILDIIPAHLGGGLTHAAAKGVAKRAVTKGGRGQQVGSTIKTDGSTTG